MSIAQPGQKPRIFVFSTAPDGGDGSAVALAEDGEVLGSHWCSHESHALYDLGAAPGFRPDRHETYAAHYPQGYDMEFVLARDLKAHEGVNKAVALNAAARAEAAAS